MQTYGNQRLIDPNDALTACVRPGRMPLPTDWAGLPNQWSNALGCTSGTGHVLLSRSSLDALDLNAQHDLVFSLAAKQVQGAGRASSVTHRNLHVVLARCVIPGKDNDGNACYLVELADRRRLLRARPVNKAYNVRSTPTAATYFSATLNVGVAWTWQQMASDLWTAAGLDGSSTLPFTPHGTPEGFAFHGAYALDALQRVLDRISCALKLDTQTDTFSVVRLASADAAAEAALAAAHGLRVLDSAFIDSPLGRYPASVRVHFPRHRATPDSTGASPYHTVDATDPDGTPTGVVAGTYAVLFDDLPAQIDAAGTVGNSSALTARAAERAADYFRRLRMNRLSRLYGLPLPEAGLRPGSQILAERHADRGRGLITQVSAWPGAVAGDPFPSMVGTGSAGASGGGMPTVAAELFSSGGTAISDNPLSVFNPPSSPPSPWQGGEKPGPSFCDPVQLLYYLQSYLPALAIDWAAVSYATTATAAGTTTLTADSATVQYFTGTTTETVALPVVSTLTLGTPYVVTNLSTGDLTITSSGGNTVAVIPSGYQATFVSTATSGTTAAAWDAKFTGSTTPAAGVTAAYTGWVKAIVTHADLTAAATSQTINLYTLPIYGLIHEVVVKHTVQFSGGTVSSLTIRVGTAGSTSKYQPAGSAITINVAPSDTINTGVFRGFFGGTNTGANSAFDSSSGTTVIQALFNSLGDNLINLTAGSVTIWLLVSTLP